MLVPANDNRAANLDPAMRCERVRNHPKDKIGLRAAVLAHSVRRERTNEAAVMAARDERECGSSRGTRLD